MNESVMKRIESIEKELSILKQEVQASEKNEVLKTKRFIPDNGEKYFYVYGNGEIVSTCYVATGSDFDKFNIKTRNCFQTEEEAKDYKRFIYIESRLRDLADGMEENDDSYFYLYFNHGRIMDYRSEDMPPIISCKNTNFRDIAIECIGEEDLKFYLTYKR